MSELCTPLSRSYYSFALCGAQKIVSPFRAMALVVSKAQVDETVCRVGCKSSSE